MTADHAPGTTASRKTLRAVDDHGRTYQHPRPTIWYVVVRTFRRLIGMQVWDIAATMTFYGLLSLLPGMVSLLSLVSMFGFADETIDAVADLVTELWPVLDHQAVMQAITTLATSPGSTLAFTLGIIGSLYSASNVIAAFHRAMHRIYDTREGRPFVVFRAIVFLQTILLVLIVTASMVMVTIGGDFSYQLGSFLGLETASLAVWNVLKWPLLLLTVMMVVSVAYRRAPNVILPRYRLLSSGGMFTVLVLFGFIVVTGWMVSNFRVLSEVMYTINGLIYAVLMIWLGAIVLLTGAVWDADLLRARQLVAGEPAWEELQLRSRNTWAIQRLDHAMKLTSFIGQVVHRSVTQDEPVTTLKTAQLTEKGKFFAIRRPKGDVSTGRPFRAELSENDFVLDDHSVGRQEPDTGLTVLPPQRPDSMSITAQLQRLRPGNNDDDKDPS